MKKAKSSILFGIIASIFILNVSLAFAKTVVVIQPHPDDEILVCAHVKHLLDEGHDVKYIWLFSDGEYSWLPGGRLYNAYYNPDNGTVKENFPVVKGLGVPVENMYFIGGGWSMTADMHLLKEKLIGLFNEINPDEIFVLQYNGGHYAHDLTAMVVRAAVEKLSFNPKVFEYAIANSYWTLITYPRSLYPDYDLMCEEFIKKYSIIPRDPGYAKEIDLTSVDVTTPEDMDVLVNYLKLYKDCVPVGVCNLFMKADREDLIYKFLREVQKFQQPVDSRQYTLPGSAFFNRPFETSAANPDGVLLYEKNSTIRYEDFSNYTKYMASGYGAVLHTKPWKNPMEVNNVSADCSLSFDLYVGNISSEEDTFSISLAAGPDRESLDGICTISQESVTISGPCDHANPDTYETLTLAINNTTDLPVTGKLKGKDVCTIWIKAVSANAWATNRLTDFVEKPINIAVSSLPSAARLPEYITTRYTATGGDGKIGGEVETGYYDMHGKDADLEWMNLEKDGHPFDDGLRPAYNNYHNQTTAYNAVKVVYDAQNSALNDHDLDGIPNEIETYEQTVFKATGFHCDILNYSNQLLENHPNIQVVNNITYGNSLFTLFFPPNWTKAGAYPVLLAGHGAGSDNNSMYLKTNISQARNAAKGIIVVQSNCGGRESQGINSNAIEDVGNFLINQMSNYGADLDRVITKGASRAGNTALVWGANPNGYAYNVLAIHAFVPPLRSGSKGIRSISTFPSLGSSANKILGSKNADRNDYQDVDQGRILSVEEKVLAGTRIILGVDSLDEAVNKSSYGYFGRGDLIGSLREKRILISQGTHDSFMPMPFFLDFDYLLGEKQISHRIVIGYCYGHGYYDDTGDSKYTIEKLANGEDIVPFEGNSRVFFMPKKLVNMGTGNKTQRQGIVHITNDVIANIKSTNGYKDYFDEDHDATKLAFSASIPYTIGQGMPVIITLMGEEGKSWKIWARKEDGYRYVYHRSGVFGESINHPHEYGYGKEYVIINFSVITEPCSYEWFFEYDGKEIPNKFTTYMNPPRLPDFPEGVPVKAVTKVTAEEPLPSEYSHPERKGGFNFGVDQYHPLLLKGNNSPELSPVNDIIVNIGDTMEFTLTAVDSDGDILVYDLMGADNNLFCRSGLEFNGLTGDFSWQTCEDDVGVYSLVAIAKDGRGGVSEQHFTVRVMP